MQSATLVLINLVQQRLRLLLTLLQPRQWERLLLTLHPQAIPQD
jgi:hypothetical protein